MSLPEDYFGEPDDRVKVDCLYCELGEQVDNIVPPTEDDETWAKLAKQHSSDCVWVLTKAYKQPMPGGGCIPGNTGHHFGDDGEATLCVYCQTPQDDQD